MKFLRRIFGKEETKISTNENFWKWFLKYEQEFHKIVKDHTKIEKKFLNKICPKLDELREGYFVLTGMYSDQIAELIITPDGNIKNIVHVEDLIETAPKLDNWRFTALKPEMTDLDNFGINMSGYSFDLDNMFFYSNESKEYPDEINISVIHNQLDEKNKDTITNGAYIFLDNYLGELDFATQIDQINVISKEESGKELVAISKLKDFIKWRKKEFIEKYEGTRHNTENDQYSIFEVKANTGKPIIAVINTDILKWDKKASHPWIINIDIEYDGNENNGMPFPDKNEELNDIEEEIMKLLKDSEGYINIGRQTGNNYKTIFFACNDFRYPTKVLDDFTNKHGGKLFEFDIYKDKYWKFFNRFNQI